MQYALADTGLWYALFDAKDPYFPQAQGKAELLERCNIVVPWPVLYETLWSGFVRNSKALRRFEAYLKTPRIIYLEDTPYRQEALDLSFGVVPQSFQTVEPSRLYYQDDS